MKRLSSVRAGHSAAIGLNQAISSLTNFLPGGVALFVLSASGYAAFALVQAAYGLTLNAARSMFGEPLLLAAPEARSSQRADDVVSGFAVLGALAGALAGVVVALAGATWPLAAVVSAGIFATVRLDGLRYRALAELNMGEANRLDVRWLLGVVASLAILGATRSISLEWVLAAWLVTPAVCAAPKPTGRLSAVRPLLATTRATWQPLLAENVLARSAPSVLVVLLALVLDQTQLTEFAAPRQLLGPLTFVLVAANVYSMRIGSNHRERDASEFNAFFYRIAVSLVVVCVIVGVAIGGTVIGLTITIAGIAHERLPALLVPTVLTVALYAPAIPMSNRLRVSGRPRASAANEFTSAAAMITLALFGAALWGVHGALYGAALGRGVGLAGWLLRR